MITIKRIMLIATSFLTIQPLRAAGPDKKDHIIETLNSTGARLTIGAAMAIATVLWAQKQHEHSTLAADASKPRLLRAQITHALQHYNLQKNNNEETATQKETLLQELSRVNNQISRLTEQQAQIQFPRTIAALTALIAAGFLIIPPIVR